MSPSAKAHPLRIRSGTKIDMAALARSHRLCFPEDPWDQGTLDGLFRMPGYFLRLADSGTGEGEVLPDGFCLARTAADEGEIVTFGVLPQRRRQGLGLALLADACGQARTAGARQLFLEVAEDNVSALALYKAGGFVVCARRPAYYDRGRLQPADALVMECSLY